MRTDDARAADVTRLAEMLVHLEERDDGGRWRCAAPELFAIIRRWTETGKALDELEREVEVLHETWQEEQLTALRRTWDPVTETWYDYTKGKPA